MLEKILRMTKEGKKGQIPRNSRLMKESLAMLYAKMKQKTKVDDLMHKLQMIKKGRVAKRKDHKSLKHVKEQSRSSALTQINSSLESSKSKKLPNKNLQKVDKTGTRRTVIENVPDNSINNDVDNTLEMSSNSREEDQDMEGEPSLDKSTGFEEVKQNDDIDGGDLMADNNEDDANADTQIENEYDSEEESSGQSPETNYETSGENSEMEFSDGIRDDIDNNNNNDDDNDDDDDDFVQDYNRNSNMYL